MNKDFQIAHWRSVTYLWIECNFVDTPCMVEVRTDGWNMWQQKRTNFDGGEFVVVVAYRVDLNAVTTTQSNVQQSNNDNQH